MPFVKRSSANALNPFCATVTLEAGMSSQPFTVLFKTRLPTVIGLGSAVGTTPAISINENLVSTFGATTVGKLFTDATNTGDITLDFTAHQNFLLTFTGNVELQNPTTENVGQSGFIVIIQDGTGSRVLSFEGDFETAGAAGITLSTAANAVDVIPYVVIAANRILLGAVQLAFS